MANFARSKLARYIPNFSSFSLALFDQAESFLSRSKIAEEWSKESALGEGGFIGDGRDLTSLECRYEVNAECVCEMRSGVNDGF